MPQNFWYNVELEIQTTSPPVLLLSPVVYFIRKTYDEWLGGWEKFPLFLADKKRFCQLSAVLMIKCSSCLENAAKYVNFPTLF